MTAAGQIARTWLSVEPLDSLMVRDGRRFAAGDASVAAGVAPAPSTFGGVVTCVYGGEVDRIVGPVAHLYDTPMFPMPVDLVETGDLARGRRLSRLPLLPRPEHEISDLDPDPAEQGAPPRLSHALAGEGDPVSGWLSGEGMAAWLSLDALPPGEIDTEAWARWAEAALWHPEPHVGIARDAASGRVLDGMFYRAGHLRPVEGLRFVLGCDHRTPPRDIAATVLPLGGRSRMASVTPATAAAAPFPTAPEDFPGGRLVVYLATPALVPQVRWVPPGTSARLCGLAVAGSQAVATASPEDPGTTSRLMWAVPAGSLYYLRFDSASEAKDWADRFHGGLLPGLPRSENPIVTAGFGTCLTGRW
ncbi:type III-B CRISPR module-associated Cmr3 family protein [Amycolatopsis sp. CA-128772]|uniref:type III-B CRISPR module-associated Cmr3 family protein n=1 Tax=Amycolatopsis sp. CA-128772 TaxID=2073159 RepID=UPI000CD0E6EE|nr:type III-B CRISPR module-associated Cmr3 family protein [Amycolatopsis sp. CA-128772]